MPPLGPTLGFLVDTLAEDYQRRIFAGLNEEAMRLDVNVACYVGGPISTVEPTTHQNRIYDCVGGERLHGLVVASGAIGNQISEHALTEFIEGFAPLPTCAVGVPVPGFASVTVDNQSGMREALVHLINDVGRKRVAFIRGPTANREAEERFRVYRDVMTEYRLSVDPDLIITGDFEAASGAAAIRTLIDERRMGFDAVVAASDLMALGALNALSERGVPVPERVSVVGFDDIEAARFATSPLTTVRQPLMDLGKHSLEMVLDQINGTLGTSEVILPARLIKRQSSMMETERHSQVASQRDSVIPDSASFEQAYRNIRPGLFLDLRREDWDEMLGLDWPEQLCNGMVSEASGRRTGLLKRSTLEYLELLLLRIAEADGDVTEFQTVITKIRETLRPLTGYNSTIGQRAEELWHRSRVLIGGMAERYHVQHRLQLRHWRRELARVGAELLRAPTRQRLAELLGTHLVNLGIPACAVCTVSGETSTIRAAFDATAPLASDIPPFPKRQLLPSGVLDGPRRRTLIVEPLFLQDRPSGYVVFEMGPTESEAYEVLRDYLTGALRGIGLSA